jgi:hypothetical protein
LVIEEEVVVALEAVVASAETEVAVVASAADVAVDAVVASAAAAEIVADVVDAAVVVVELEAVLAQALRSSSSLTHVSPAFTFNAAKMMFF